MKTRFYTQTLIALVAALAAATSNLGCAEEHPIPPPSAAAPVATTPAPPVTSAVPIAPVATPAAAPLPMVANTPTLPPEILADSSLGQVVKLVQAGVDLNVVNNFIGSVTTPFNLDAEKIISLTDAGVPSAAVNAMMERDKTLLAPARNPPVQTKTVVVTETVPPAAPVTVNYFYDTLTPYGAWVDVDGYGRCWRPTVVNYDAGWRPYSDRGHWVNTDCGWYWDSDYSWGSTFHYGRWFRNSRFGWCWYPDTEWAPSWVTWRSCDDYRGWAPLPPFATFHTGGGFVYRDENVSVSFGFGLGADCFTFVSPSHFFDHHPRRFCPEEREVTQIFNRTTIINNYNYSSDHGDNRGGNRNGESASGRGGERGGDRGRIINTGIPVAQVGRDDHRDNTPVQVASLPNAGRHGWRGNDDNQPVRREGGNNQPGAQPGNRANGNDNSNRRGNEAAANSSRNSSPISAVTPPGTPRTQSDGNGNQRGNRNDNAAAQTGGQPSGEGRNRAENNSADNHNRRLPVAPPAGNADNAVQRGNVSNPVQVSPVVPANDNGSQQRNGERPGNRQLGGGNNRPATAIIPAHNPPPVMALPQNNERNLRDETQNRIRNQPVPVQPTQPQISAPTQPERSRPQNEGRNARTFETPPAVTQPTPRSEPRMEQRQPAEVSRPTPERRQQNVEQRSEPRTEQRQSHVEIAPRVAPQPASPPPAQPAARSENQSHNTERNADHNSNRNSESNSDRNKKDR